MSNEQGQPPAGYAWGHPPYQQQQQERAGIMQITDHDVLSGRGINISQHPGNERFRALVNTRQDRNYCHSYSTSEKRAVADEIIGHIKALNPPGRFLKRSGRASRNARGLSGPWEELSEKEAVKKTCQALRDCNRQDRAGYATSVYVPHDVQFYEQQRSQSGMTNKQLAEKAAIQAKIEAEHAAAEVRTRTAQEAFSLSGEPIPEPTPIGYETTSTTPTATAMAATWPKRQKLSDPDITPMPNATPATAGSSGGMTLQDDSHALLEDDEDYSPVAAAAASLLSSSHHMSPSAANSFSEELAFAEEDEEEEDSKPAAIPSINVHLQHHQHHQATNDMVDPLHLAAEAAAAIEGVHAHSLLGAPHHRRHPSSGVDDQDFGPPSPLHSDDHQDDHDDDLSDHSHF